MNQNQEKQEEPQRLVQIAGSLPRLESLWQRANRHWDREE